MSTPALAPDQATGEGFRESHIAFAASDRATVRAFFDAAVATDQWQSQLAAYAKNQGFNVTVG